MTSQILPPPLGEEGECGMAFSLPECLLLLAALLGPDSLPQGGMDLLAGATERALQSDPGCGQAGLLCSLGLSFHICNEFVTSHNQQGCCSE